MIPTLSLNSSQAPTELCVLGAKCATDKSPFNPLGHRHPYTPFYSLMLSQYKERPVRFAEIGVAAGASVAMWAQYFRNPERKLFFFDRDTMFLNNAKDMCFERTFFDCMDVSQPESIRESLERTGGELDILLDDSSHDIWHQVGIVREGLAFVRSGGMLIVEDVFRNVPAEHYWQHVVEPVKGQLAFWAFVEMEHTNKWSPGWDNDKILILIKK